MSGPGTAPRRDDARTTRVTELETRTEPSSQVWTITLTVLQPGVRWGDVTPIAADLPADVRTALRAWLDTAEES